MEPEVGETHWLFRVGAVYFLGSKQGRAIYASADGNVWDGGDRDQPKLIGSVQLNGKPIMKESLWDGAGTPEDYTVWATALLLRVVWQEREEWTWSN